MFALRLSEKTQGELAAMAKVYGAPTSSAFAREILEVVVSGDIERVKAFNARLIAKVGEQLQMKFSAALDEAAGAGKPAKKPRKPQKQVRGRGGR